MLAWWMGALIAEAGPTASILVGFEPRALSTTANDETLEAYGFTPVGTPFLPTFGLRGRVDAASRLTTTFEMSYGFGLRRDGDTNVTTTTMLLLGGGPGVRFGRAHLGATFGWATVTHSVASDVSGGALTYLGPYAEPRASLRLVDGPGVLEVSVAGLLQVPVGPAHGNPFWEAPFRRRVLGGASIAIHGGLGTRSP